MLQLKKVNGETICISSESGLHINYSSLMRESIAQFYYTDHNCSYRGAPRYPDRERNPWLAPLNVFRRLHD